MAPLIRQCCTAEDCALSLFLRILGWVLRNLFLVTFSPASLHQHSLCQRDVWGTGWKKPNSLLLLILLQKQQRWNSGFVAINRTHAKSWRVESHPARLLSVMLMQPPYIHSLQRTGVFRWIHQKKNPNAKGRKGKVLLKTSVFREQDFPLQRPPSPPASPALLSNSAPHLRRQSCTVRTSQTFRIPLFCAFEVLTSLPGLMFPNKCTNWHLRAKTAMKFAFLLRYKHVLCGSCIHYRTENAHLVIMFLLKKKLSNKNWFLMMVSWAGCAGVFFSFSIIFKEPFLMQTRAFTDQHQYLFAFGVH